MSKVLGISLIILGLVSGIVLGNLYGRRDVTNSRPPQIEGELDVPGTVGVENPAYKLSHLQLLDSGRAQSLGGVSVLQKSTGPAEAVINIWKLGEFEGEIDGAFRLVLYSADNLPVKELTRFNLGSGGGIALRLELEKLEPGQYFVVMPKSSGDIILQSEPVE